MRELLTVATGRTTPEARRDFWSKGTRATSAAGGSGRTGASRALGKGELGRWQS
jgi:hypothetical protein